MISIYRQKFCNSNHSRPLWRIPEVAEVGPALVVGQNDVTATVTGE